MKKIRTWLIPGCEGEPLNPGTLKVVPYGQKLALLQTTNAILAIGGLEDPPTGY
jgi:hypothetical protein